MRNIKFAAVVILIFSIIFTFTWGCKETAVEKDLEMRWGIPQEFEAFEELERSPQGEEVELVSEDTMEVTWKTGESYILPLSATSDGELEGVRYYGHGIPASLQLEWLDPWEGEWYPLEEIPSDLIRADIREEAGTLSVFFGPPSGADFEEGMIRGIWFRVTPTREKEFNFFIYGYQEDKEMEDPSLITPVSNMLSLRGRVE
ncbi:MAG: hypothetical protein D5R97_08595 [Candidatus Syntrophonatronum acetioxidans]|uniref:Uncharacterized protein n=1 Tax=Candidatus Syntrophonatronum acetioxidans TaxID=1795816 RepID=A0A424YAV5_9FIRM|nr:MAG: hypothetical protein D5R97_08595 [Candidatus Syntrophonatronum acetioxidans]